MYVSVSLKVKGWVDVICRVIGFMIKSRRINRISRYPIRSLPDIVDTGLNNTV